MSKVVSIGKKKKKSKNHSRFLGLVLVVLIFCFLLVSPIFSIENIEVKGNNNVLSKYIVSESGIFFGQNIFKMNKFDAIERLKSIPQIESASIKRKLPSAIVINVIEKKTVARVEFYGAELLISEDGDVLEVITDGEIVNIPQLKGITINDVIVGDKVMCNEEDILEKYLQVLKILIKNDMLESVEKITYKDGVLIHFGIGHIAFLGERENLEYKMAWLEKMVNIEENPSYIDLHNLDKVITKPVWGMFNEADDAVENDFRGEVNEE